MNKEQLENYLFDLKMPNYIFGQFETCTYCGDFANQIDHVIPLTQFTHLPRKTADKYGIRTYACGSCNQLIGDKYFETFAKRCEFARLRIERKTKAKYKDTGWTDEEIAGLDYSLRGYVARHQYKAQLLTKRLQWYGSFDFYENIKQLETWERLDIHSPKYIEWVHFYFQGFYNNSQTKATMP
jgi:hypothetical protein